MIDGKLYYGRDGMAGLPGRMTGVPLGRDATSRMLEKIHAWGGEQAYLERVANRDGEASEIYAAAVKNYGYRLAHLANAFNPHAVLLFSPYEALGDAFLKQVRDEALRYAGEEHGWSEPTIFEGMDFEFAGHRCEKEWLSAAAVPPLSRVFVHGDFEAHPSVSGAAKGLVPV